MAEVYGIEVKDLPEGYQPLEVVVIVKCLDTTDGEAPQRLVLRNSDVTTWEAWGMCKVAMVGYEKDITDDLDQDDDE